MLEIIIIRYYSILDSLPVRGLRAIEYLHKVIANRKFIRRKKKHAKLSTLIH